MTSPRQLHDIRRVLVALDSRVRSFSALLAAADLAARTEAELVALFVEDVDLAHLAGLPFVREIDRCSGQPREIDRARMARATTARVEQVRAALEATNRRQSVHWSLNVVQGRYLSEALSASAEMDVLFLSRTWQGHFVGSLRMRAEITGDPITGSAARPVYVLYDGSAEAVRALALAAALADPQAQVTVLVPRVAERRVASLQEEAARALAEGGSTARYEIIASNQGGAVLDAVCAGGAGLLVLHRRAPLLQNNACNAALEEFSCALVVAP